MENVPEDQNVMVDIVQLHVHQMEIALVVKLVVVECVDLNALMIQDAHRYVS
jgi:hypothetical protein